MNALTHLLRITNPLVDALGPLLDSQQIIKKLKRASPMNGKIRRLDAQTRMVAGDILFDNVVIPSPVYVDVYTAMFSAMLRRYSAIRLDPAHVRRSYGVQSMPACAVQKQLVKPSSSIIVVGPTGTGKTTMLNALAGLWPSQVEHPNLIKGQTVTQIPVLYVQLTGRVRERSLYLRIVEAMDERLGGSELLDRLKYRRLPEPELRSAALRMCVQLNVGIIVFDEAHRLSGAQSDTPDSAINEMLYLRDGLGIPLVFSGTYTLMRLLGQDERLYRRACENGIFPLLFADSANDAHWSHVCQAYWERLVLRDMRPLNGPLRRALFDLTAGMPWALKLLLQTAQRRALSNHKECIDEATLALAFKNDLTTIHPIIEALRTRDSESLKRYEHLYNPMFDRELQRKASAETDYVQQVLALSEQPLAKAA